MTRQFHFDLAIRAANLRVVAVLFDVHFRVCVPNVPRHRSLFRGKNCGFLADVPAPDDVVDRAREDGVAVLAEGDGRDGVVLADDGGPASVPHAGVPDAEGLVVGGAGHDGVVGARWCDRVDDGLVPGETCDELVALDVDDAECLVGRARYYVVPIETPLDVEHRVVMYFESEEIVTVSLNIP